jgi:hypothetical protein
MIAVCYTYAGRDVLVLTVGPASGVAPWFASVERLPDAQVRLRGRVLATVSVTLGRGLRAPVSSP